MRIFDWPRRVIARLRHRRHRGGDDVADEYLDDDQALNSSHFTDIDDGSIDEGHQPGSR